MKPENLERLRTAVAADLKAAPQVKVTAARAALKSLDAKHKADAPFADEAAFRERRKAALADLEQAEFSALIARRRALLLAENEHKSSNRAKAQG